MLTDAQRDGHAAFLKAMNDAPDDLLLDWVYVELADSPRFTGHDLEQFSNRIGRAGHEKNRELME